MNDLAVFIQDMNEEAGLLMSFSIIEEEMLKAISERRWDGLESIIIRLRKKSDLLNQAEDKRVQSFELLKTNLGVPSSAGFFKILPIVKDEKRAQMTESYRKLKLAIYSVKGATLRLSYYFQSLSETFKKVMGELFPHRKGKLYTRTGKLTKTIDDTLVLNKSL
jgi:hypothetical protein